MAASGQSQHQDASVLAELWLELRLALSFLTVLPIGPCAAVTPRQLGRSMAFFPLTGLLIGALAAGVALLGNRFLPAGPAAFLTLGSIVLLTGALHLDGVADSADGLYGVRDQKSRLRIMKDSRIGAMGVVALILLLLGKWSALASLPAEVQPQLLLALPVAGRWLMTALAVLSPYARPEGGTGGAFVAAAGRRELLIATLILLGVMLPLCGPLLGLSLVTALMLAALGWRRYALAKLGGVTGDVLGAACEWSEAALLLFWSALFFHPF